MNEILKLSEVFLPKIVKQPVITKTKKSELRMFGSLKAERRRTTRIAKRIKAQIDTWLKVIKGIKEQLVHAVKNRRVKQNKEKNWAKQKKLNRRKEFKKRKKVNISEERLTTYQQKGETSRKVFI